MPEIKKYKSDAEIQWCPGCPNFGILQAMKKALSTMGKAPEKLCLVSGIGQAAKFPHYLRCNFFNGLHGRALPAALGIHVANPKLTVIVTTGEGDCYGEGGNHFLHMLRRNPNITLVVHNNAFYALTKGQASPTTPTGEQRSLHPKGLEIAPLNLPAVAVVHNCTFVARGFAGDIEDLASLLASAVRHEGFSYLEVLQPCITWSKLPLDGYKERVDRLEASHDPNDRASALARLLEPTDQYTTGIFYRRAPQETFGARFRREVTARPFAELTPLPESKIAAFVSRFGPAAHRR